MVVKSRINSNVNRKDRQKVNRRPIRKKLGYQDLMQIYNGLLGHFGPRHWWPADSTLEIVVGAVLTQSVAWKNVEKAINNLKLADMLSFDGILKTSEEELGQLIIPTLYWRMKAKKLKALFEFIASNYNSSFDVMFNRPLDELRLELLRVYGIGPETADSILLYAGQYPIFVIDAYTKRIFQRIGAFNEDINYDEMQKYFMESLPKEVPLYNEYHALIVGLGNQICTARKPKCGQCPIQENCCYGVKEG